MATRNVQQPASGTRASSDIVTLVQNVNPDGTVGVEGGGSSTSAHAAVSIGTSAAVIKAANPTRQSISIQNAHASNVLYLGKDTNVTTANAGLVVQPGGSVSFDDYTGAVWGIASAAATDVRYWDVG